MQTTTENAVIEKTRELCQTILDQSEFQGVRRDIDAFLADDAAKSLYEKLSEKGEYLHHKQHQGLPLDGGEIAEYEGLRTQFMNNPAARKFVNAQETMHAVQETVGSYVAKTFELGRLPTESDFESSGNCGSGCGCDHNH
jgi:cell fate (sporulation/competence/biofilm development) regulator YlbF (YheA/YmcA/DUF963 family)